MSQKYKFGAHIPTEVLTGRLMELVNVITKEHHRLRDEFTMRIPAERDRDADLVLSECATRLTALETQVAELTAERDRLREIEAIVKRADPYYEPSFNEHSLILDSRTDAERITELLREQENG